MKKIAFYVFILLFITACQVVKMPKKPLKAEQVILAYFLDSLVPNDSHLKGREFEFDFVVRQGIGDWELSVHANAFRWYNTARYISEDTASFNTHSGDRQVYEGPLKMKRIRKIKKVKYAIFPYSNSLSKSYVPISSSIEINRIDFTKKKEGQLYLGSEYTELKNGSVYTGIRLAVIYVNENTLHEKLYYFALRNAVIKGLTCYTTNHTIPYSQGKTKYLITPY